MKMSKSIAEDIRDLMNKMEAAGSPRSYDVEIEVENWDYPEDPDDENWPAYRTLGINYSIYGKYVPARIRYDDYDHPAEYPELDAVEVYDAETGQPLTNLPPEIDKQIEDAIWKNHESSGDDYDPPDDYNDRY